MIKFAVVLLLSCCAATSIQDYYEKVTSTPSEDTVVSLAPVGSAAWLEQEAAKSQAVRDQIQREMAERCVAQKCDSSTSTYSADAAEMDQFSRERGLAYAEAARQKYGW